MRLLKSFASMALIVVLVLSIPLSVYAADSAVNYTGHNIFDMDPGSTYTLTDLFDNFKGIMPGDERVETLTIRNSAGCCDYIKVYLRVVLHDEEENPLSPKVADHPETIASMTDFLNQLDMVVKVGGTVIFSGKAGELNGLQNNVYIGAIPRFKSKKLNVTLSVPMELDNRYANRAGEVDWLFTVEEYDGEGPATGDHTNVTLYWVILALGAVGMTALLVIRRKKKTA